MYNTNPSPSNFLASALSSFTSGKHFTGLHSPWMHRDGQQQKATTSYILYRSLTGRCSIDHNKISVIDSEKLKASVYLPIHQAVIITASWHWCRKNIRNSFVLSNTDWECQRVVATGIITKCSASGV